MASTTNDYRLTNVTTEKTNALNNLNNTYNNMVNNSQKYYDDLINNSKDWTNKQQAIQQANTNWAVDKIEQSKEQAEKDYIKEQKGAYTDYQKAIDEYGVNAEQRASTGMNNSGYTETAQMMAFNSYQNRYASAREDYNKAILNYDNSIKDAMLQNSSSLAQIAYEGLQSQLELALQGFQYKNELLQNQISSQMQMESLYETKYNNVLNQINEENRLAEEKRQFDAQLAENRRQFNATQAAKAKESSGIALTEGNGGLSNTSGDVELTKVTKKIPRSNVLKGFVDQGYTLYADKDGRIFFEDKNGEMKSTGIVNKSFV